MVFVVMILIFGIESDCMWMGLGVGNVFFGFFGYFYYYGFFVVIVYVNNWFFFLIVKFVF